MNFKSILRAFELVLIISNSTIAQTDKVLDDYLTKNRYFFTRNMDSTISVSHDLGQMLLKRMHNKSLFVYGEGWSHGLRANNSIAIALTEFYSRNGLKTYFVESSRSWVVAENYFLSHPGITAAAFLPKEQPFYQKAFERKRRIYNSSHFKYSAIDFERPQSMYHVLVLLANGLDHDQKIKMTQLAPYISDTSWLELTPKQFVAFYKEQRDKFYQDSSKFHEVMGTEYQSFRYLMSDPEPSAYHDNRNRHMADHILAQLPPSNDSDIYILDCGMAHSRPGKKEGRQKTTVRLLAESERLKKRIVVMNLYGDSCIPAGDNWALDFMKSDILCSFKHAVTGSIVVFDLSDLPEKYSFIKENYGDILVYVTKVE